MTKRPAADEEQQRALRELFVVIVARDTQASSRILKSSPALARTAASVGATRQDPKSYYFECITHYAYAGDTALHLAAAAHSPEIARQLVSTGADTRARNRRGAEPLHYAADGTPAAPTFNAEEQAAVIDVLLEAGAEVDALDDSGVAPLHRAVRTRSTAAVGALLAGGANPRIRNGSGSTPLHLAVQNTGRGGSGSPVCKREQAAIIELLLEYGATSVDKNGAGKSVHESAGTAWLELLTDPKKR
jgi:hypothetical protein